jgi:surfactin synthase thioesterase subunit
MREVVTALGAAIRPLLDRPFAIFGHSVGALIGYELARHVSKETLQAPEHLFVSGCQPPHFPRLPAMHDLPEPVLVNELLRMNGTPKVLLEDAELRRILLPVVRADLRIYETYVDRDRPPLDCRITTFSGLDDSRARPDAMGEWRRYTIAPFTPRTLAGDHFFLHSSSTEIARIIRGELEEPGSIT